MNDMYTMGIDIGSTASKCIILGDGKDILAKALIPFGAGTSGPDRVIKEALENSQFKESDMKYILATGYGRNSIAMANYEMSELTCHAKGAHFLFPSVRTVIDIGGQDVKVLKIGESGMLEQFVMNDKCAAGTGRFLEVMARALEVRVEDLEKLSSLSTKRVDISSTCTVFAESEVISQLSQNKDKCDIIDGIHRSIAGRVASQVRRAGVTPDVVMTGGVAQNSGVRLALEKELNVQIKYSSISQYVGALGAAILAYIKVNKNNNDS